MQQLILPGFEIEQQAICPLCGQVATLFGQYGPHLPWGVCRECSIKEPYPIELFVPSTRRNQDKNPIMIDPNSSHELRERRILLDEAVRCGIDPSRRERPVVKYNLSGLELMNPIRRSKMQQYNRWHKNYLVKRESRQMQLPICEVCGEVHDRSYEMLPGQRDYWSTCQGCDDKRSVEALWRVRGIFGGDDVETVMDRLYKSHPELFERGVLPDYWFELMLRDGEYHGR